VPQLPEAAVENRFPERVQNRTSEQIMDFSVPRILEAVVEVGRVTPYVDEPVPQVAAEEIVDRMRAFQEVWRRLHEQNGYDEEEEEEEEDGEDDDARHFAPGFRPRRWCQFVVHGRCCPYGNRCTFAHHELEFR